MLTTSTRTAIRQAAGDIRATFLPLLGFDLIVAAVSVLVFTPLIAWLFRRLVASTGKNVLSDMEIADFLLSPFGIAAMVLVHGALARPPWAVPECPPRPPPSEKECTSSHV